MVHNKIQLIQAQNYIGIYDNQGTEIYEITKCK